jgi:5-formyltetrahydrofolate cyclo-ligase
MQPQSPASVKKALRKQMRARRDAATPEQRTAWSEEICRRAVTSPAYQAAQVVHCFLSIQSEVDTRLIIERAFAAGKRIATPIFVRNSDETPSCEITSLADEDYEIGGFGLRVPRHMRPVDLRQIDLVLVPLLAFLPLPQGTPEAKLHDDHAGEGRGEGPGAPRIARLGYGAGYYDTFLTRLRISTPRARIIGVAFDLQRVAELPIEPHDALLDGVITESGFWA